MDEFYVDLMGWMSIRRRCEKCNDMMWLGYSDGHVWDECLNCPEQFSLDPAGYVTTYDVPKGPLPGCLEAREMDNYPRLPHERFYRFKKVMFKEQRGQE